MKEMIRKILRAVFKIMAIIVYRPKIIGKENIPQNGAAILCSNHVHALDAAVIVVMSKRKINVLAKQELFKNKFICLLADLFGIYPVKREKKSIESIKISLQLLKNNELLLIFPEGTRNGIAKKIKPKNGSIKLALKADVPIIPIGIKGDFKVFHKVVVNIGKPIYYSEYKEEINNKEVLDKLTEELLKTSICLANNSK